METARLPYIDKLKGLAMILVVMGHTLYFCTYHEQFFHDPIFSIICTFHVPLFFFLSGFVISKAPTPQKFLHKAYRFLMPMLVVGLINALLIGKVKDFFLNGGHNGYWYLFTLTVFYLLLIPFQLTHHLKNVKGIITDITLSLVIWLMLYWLMRFNDNPFLLAMNSWGAFAFWPFFIIGFLCRKYSILNYLFNRNYLTIVFPLVYLLLLVTSFQHIDNLPHYLDFTIAITAIIALLLIFHLFNNNNNFIDRQLLLIGNNTLNIYIYHYFFIRFINLDFLKSQNLFIELLVTVGLTTVITYASIFIGIVIPLRTLYGRSDG